MAETVVTLVVFHQVQMWWSTFSLLYRRNFIRMHLFPLIAWFTKR